MTLGVIAVLGATAVAVGGAMLWIPATDGTDRWWNPNAIELVHPWRGDVWWNGPWGEFPTTTEWWVTTSWGSQATVVVRGDPVGGCSTAAPAEVPRATATSGLPQSHDREAASANATASPAHETIRLGTISMSIAQVAPRQVILPLLVLELLIILGSGLSLALWLHRRARRQAAAETPVLA